MNDVKVDLDKMMANKASSVDSLTGGIEFLFKKYKVDYLQGKGTLQGPNSVGVALNDGGAETLDAAHILLATGSEVSPLPPCPVDNAGGRIVDSTGALDLKEIPKTMAVIGAARSRVDTRFRGALVGSMAWGRTAVPRGRPTDRLSTQA